MKINNIRIAIRLLLGFGIMLALMISLALLSITQYNTITEAIGNNKGKIDKRTNLRDKEINHLDWALAVTKGLASGRAEEINVETDGHKCKFGEWYYSDARIALEKDIPSLGKPLAEIEAPHLQLHNDVIALKAVLRAGGANASKNAINIFNEKVGNDLKQVRLHLNEMRGIIGNTVVKSDESVFAGISRSKIIIAGISLISIIMGALIGVLISYSITKPIKQCVGLAGRMANGDFTSTIKTDRKDEMGELVNSLNDSSRNLEKLITDAITGSMELAQAVQEIASGNENLSQRTAEQASSLEEVASTIEEAAASIKQNAENAISGKKMANDSYRIAEEGGRVMSDTIAAINEVNAYSKKIGEITSLINEIAFQTNLLALNAAVEAARAGEQGRGFAVVAGEVRNLAQRAASSSKEISKLIQDSLGKVSIGTELANKSGEALQEIIHSVKEVDRLISEISIAGEEQKRGIDQINIAVTELDTMTQQNAALVEETSSASEEMANQSQELILMMEKFKIRDDIRNAIGSKNEKKPNMRAIRATGAAKSEGNGKKNPVTQAAIDSNSGNIKEKMTGEGFKEF